jgi:hypothetical protein
LLRVEQLESRHVLSATWTAVFRGFTPGGTLEEQARYGQELLASYGIAEESVHVVQALDFSGTFLVATPDDVTVDITIPTSASNADTTGVMRSSGSDGSYIYNMNINLPQSALNSDYTVIIYPYGNGQPVGPTMRHVIQATK